MAVTSRIELIDYCLRRLGAPVLEINVDPDQVEDRIDEALQFYQAYHSDALHHDFYIHLVDATDVANKYVTVPESFAYIRHIIDLAAGASGTSSASMLSDFWQYSAGQYQTVLGGILSGGGSGGMISFSLGMQQIETLNMTLSGKQRCRFSRHMDRVYIEDAMTAGEYIVVDGYSIIDPELFTDIYDDYFLKKYATALIKKQWGSNLIKFTGMQLPGGVQFSGEFIYGEAKEEIEKLEEEMRLNWEMPPDFFVG